MIEGTATNLDTASAEAKAELARHLDDISRRNARPSPSAAGQTARLVEEHAVRCAEL